MATQGTQEHTVHNHKEEYSESLLSASCSAMIIPDWMSIAVRIGCASKPLYDWKLAVLLWMTVLSASCLYAYWTPTPVREMCHVVFEYFLWCWLLVLHLPLYLAVVPHHWELLMLLKVCPACPRLVCCLCWLCCLFIFYQSCVLSFSSNWLYLGVSPRYESLDVWPVMCLLWYVKRCSRLNMYSLPVWAFSVPVVFSRMYF